MDDLKIITVVLSIILSLISIYLAIKYEIKKSINSIILQKIEEEKRLISIEEKINSVLSSNELNHKVFNGRLKRIENIVFTDNAFK